MSYFQLAFEDDVHEVGAYPQISEVLASYDTSSSKAFTQLKYDQKPEGQIDLSGFVFDSRAKVTDVLSCWMLFSSEGLFVNEKVKKLLNGFALKNCQYLEAIIHKGAELYNYQFLFVMHALNLVDFKASTIEAKHIADFRMEPISVEIKSSEDFLLQYKEYYKKERKLAFKRVVLNDEVDLMRLPFNAHIYVSDRLRNEIECQQITGLRFEAPQLEIVAPNITDVPN